MRERRGFGIIRLACVRHTNDEDQPEHGGSWPKFAPRAASLASSF
jgi:hypothetical protein